MVVKLKHDASSSAVGNIYQYYHAIDWCFGLTLDQTLYIEKFGDIAISESVNIEIKHYGDNLTDSHENIWNTLKNWLQSDFDDTAYSQLVLLTTQSIGPASKLNGWNNKDTSTKLGILEEIHHAAELRFTASKKKGKDKKPDSLLNMELVLAKTNKTKLNNVLGKFKILDSSPMEQGNRSISD